MIFLYGVPQKEIYIQQLVYRSRTILYTLNRANHQWYEYFNMFISSHGY